MVEEHLRGEVNVAGGVDAVNEELVAVRLGRDREGLVHLVVERDARGLDRNATILQTLQASCRPIQQIAKKTVSNSEVNAATTRHSVLLHT